MELRGLHFPALTETPLGSSRIVGDRVANKTIDWEAIRTLAIREKKFPEVKKNFLYLVTGQCTAVSLLSG